MLNKCFFVGNIGKEPELKFGSNGNAYMKLSLAVSSGFGENKKTNWANITLFAKKAEKAKDMLHKGSKILVECEYTVNSWDKDGVKQYSTDFIANNFVSLDSSNDSNYSETF